MIHGRVVARIFPGGESTFKREKFTKGQKTPEYRNYHGSHAASPFATLAIYATDPWRPKGGNGETASEKESGLEKIKFIRIFVM